VAGSAWISRVVSAAIQLLSVRIIIENLGTDQYAVFGLLTGLMGWYMLVEMGVGTSLQNFISEYRAKDQTYVKYIVSAGMVAFVLLFPLLFILYILSPYLAPFFLKQFYFLSDAEKIKDFFSIGSLFIAATIGGIAYRVWYAQQRGYISNLLTALGSLISFFGILTVTQSQLSNKLFLSLVMYALPSTILSIASLCYLTIKNMNNGFRWETEVVENLLRRAGRFWLLAIMAACVLQVDSIIISQFIEIKEIVIYLISTRIYGFIFFIYNAVLLALWPVFAEAIARNKWDIINRNLTNYLTAGISMMVVATSVLLWLMPFIVHILSPAEKIEVPLFFIIILGVYYLLRVWTDTFSMVLGSMNDLKPLWLFVPFQGMLSIFFQLILAPKYGVYGIVLGLIISFILTVAWGLPRAVRQHALNSNRDII